MKFFVALAALVSACSARGADLLVASASDLAPLTAALEKGFGHVRFTLASSGSLARQIENGAPFDVFLSANDQYVKELAASGNITPSTVVVYAQGRIALYGVRSLEDLKNPA